MNYSRLSVLSVTGFAVLLVSVLASMASADIVIYKTGKYVDCQITGVDEKKITIKMEYGNQAITRGELLGWYQTELGKPGSEYYRGGELLVKWNMHRQAQPLFQKAVSLNPAYEQPARNLLAGGNPGGATPGTNPNGPAVTVVGPKMARELLKCPKCAGEGKLQQDHQTPAGTTISRVIPCFFCDGKGAKFVYYPVAARICPDCGGWGYVEGSIATSGASTSSSSGSSSGSTTKMESKGPAVQQRKVCFRCKGKGWIEQAAAVHTVRETEQPYVVVGEQPGVGYSGSASGNTPSNPTTNPGTGYTSPTTSNPGTGFTSPITTSPNMNQSNNTEVRESSSDDGDKDEGKEEKKDADDDDDDDGGFFKNRTTLLLVGAGVVLLIIILVMSQSGKK